MNSLELDIKKKISQGLNTLFNIQLDEDKISLQPTKPEFKGSFTFVTFSITKLTNKSPEETGKLLGEYLVKDPSICSAYNIVKGFLNLEITDSAWIKTFQAIYLDKSFGKLTPKNKKIMVEYSSPNTNKPLHLGHLRNIFLGYSLSEILKTAGYEVIKANLINDRGIHICKSMIAYSQYGNSETPDTSGLKGDHLIGKYYVMFDKLYKAEIEQLIAAGNTKEEAEKKAPIMLQAQKLLVNWENGDSETIDLWKKMNQWVYDGFNSTYQKIGVDFDKFYYESDTYLLGKNIVNEGLSADVFFKKEDNSVWIDLSPEGLDQKLLLRSDGTSVYITQDLGTAELKYTEFGFEKSVYVVGNEQDYHFKVLKLILEKMNKPYASGIYHLSYGMVDLPSGKMKSREGTVVDADDLIQEMTETAAMHTKELGKIEGFSETEAQALYHKLGLGALKYFLLKVDPKKRMLFNPQESVEFQGNTGPFIQYTYARISSLLRKAKQLNIQSDNLDFNQITSLEITERETINLLKDFPAKIEEAANLFSPSLIAQYVYDLAKQYNRFYNEVSIFNESNPQLLTFRIAFSDSIASAIKKSMKLLGIEVPEKM
ncbi:MAG: arginine--tRNA ligase [Cytophagales bacterium]|nr:MAG: arginine--tRNA ligase [Cytophagales bacterium]